MSFIEKNIIITGGSGLLGNQIIIDLLGRNANCINLDIIPHNNHFNENVDYYKCDVTSEKEVDETLSLILKKYGKIHGLVNAAYPRTNDWTKPINKIPLESWKKNIDYQLNSCFQINRIVCDFMKQAKGGSVVNIASIYGVIGPDFSIYEESDFTSPAPYSAIKGGIISFTRYLASYYGKYNLRINTISPGGIFDNQDKNFVKKYINKVPLGRMGNPEDISKSVLFLLSENSSYITGQNLIIDGGLTIT
jgi:NAD(P)-dependent dehydrogenase (short-subunit alcohol dehydrogenase family)